MCQFKSAAHFASWAGLVPECNKSAGKKKSVKIRKGNKTLKTTLVECACSAIRNKNGFFHARYKKISARRGGKRTLITIARSMLLSIYAMLRDKQAFLSSLFSKAHPTGQASFVAFFIRLCLDSWDGFRTAPLFSTYT